MVERKREKDKQKLLNVYIPIIEDMHKPVILSYNELVKQLKLNFNLDCDLNEVRLHFEKTIFEEELDLKIQAKNLNLCYD